MSKSLSELFGSDVVMGTPSLGVNGDNGSHPQAEQEVSAQKRRELNRYFVSYVVGGAYGNSVMANIGGVLYHEDINQMELILQQGLGYDTKPTIIGLTYLGKG